FVVKWQSNEKLRGAGEDIKMKNLILAFICLLLAIPCNAATITVNWDGSGDYTTIQAAIDDAYNGDVVIIAPGTYTGEGNRDIDLGGHTITVRSTNPDDPVIVAKTIIDCQNNGRGFILNNNNSSLSGLTITNGYTTSHGGGIHSYGSSPTISNCIFSHNSAHAGGGMDAKKGWSQPKLINCTFIANSSTYGGGGGLRIDSGCTATLSNCAFISNTANRYRGGGIRTSDSDITLNNCIFIGNTAGDGGGGIGDNGAHPNVELTNCTFFGNTAGETGGGIDVGHLSHQTLTNCIFWNNSDRNGIGELSQIGPEALTHSINYNCIQDWTGSLGGIGNIGDDPNFAPDGYHLLVCSPCIDTGDPAYDGAGETDIDGQTRVMGSRVDMGVDEFNLEEALLGIWPTGFEVLAAEGGPNPEAQVLYIYNAGIDTINWEVEENCNWLYVTPTTGESSGEVDKVTLSVDTTGLGRGGYNCLVAISDSNVANSPQTVAVNIVVQGPIIELSANKFEFHADVN
ncbi:unnamed protein product, partial [marine sediment metagenome]